MKKILVITLAALVLTAASAFAGNTFPDTLAGFKLGEDINQYESFCNMHEANAMSDAPFLTEVLIKPDVLPGVRGGSLNYGNCQNKNKLVRIKLKFNDRSQKLFEKLLKRYKRAFGDPNGYKGDAFKNVIAWEWIFTNRDGEKMNVLLMWSRDNEIRPGVSIKMTNVSLYDQEYDCYKARDYGFKKGKGSKIKSLEMYVPK